VDAGTEGGIRGQVIRGFGAAALSNGPLTCTGVNIMKLDDHPLFLTLIFSS
jgi:hypothetical protein